MSRNPTLPGMELAIADPADIVYTPDWCAKDMVDHFQPVGKVLEPCRGGGAIYQYLPNADWCEITEGKDFFNWNKQVDWIITNPPYSLFREFVEHGFRVSTNAVYLVPLKNFFSAYGFIEMCLSYGWVKHIRVYGTGSRLNFPMGNAIGAIHFARNYSGPTTWSFYGMPNKSLEPTR